MTRGPHVGEHGLGGGRVEGEPRARLRVAADMGGGGVGGAGGGRVTSHAPTEASVLGLLLHSVQSLNVKKNIHQKPRDNINVLEGRKI